MGVGNARRYYLLKAAEADRQEERGLASAWRAKQAAVAGTLLAADFPARASLAAAGYTTEEDLRGPSDEQSADADELVGAGLRRWEAEAAVAAAKEL